MSAKNKELETEIISPIIIESEANLEIPQGLNLYLISFKWIPQEFVNLESGTKIKIKFWTKGGLVSLTTVLRNGRHVVVHEKVPKYIVDKKGIVLETRMINKTRITGREFGFKALASIMSAIFPCTPKKAEELVREALDKRISHAKLILKSDLLPTSPDKYRKMGLKNGWVMVSDYPSSDEIQKNVNEVLKLQRSPLRARFGLKWRLQE